AAHVDALDVMPVVRRHEKQAAALRVMVAVRAGCVLDPRGGSVRAGSWRQIFDARPIRTRPRHRHGHVHELAAADWAPARFGSGDHGMDGTAPGGLEPDRLELHPADWTEAGTVVHDLGVHRARPRKRRGPR